ncbi:hypothetical protein NH340_JMT07213 [Sarcoptes scabiei]|nr:hypothetical protein NH340_JMT07213 [Sarcoptes scabiei]
MPIKRFRSIRSFEDNYVFLDLELRFHPNGKNRSNDPIEAREFKMIIIQNINTLHGEYGSKIFFDILKHCPKNCRAFIRVDARNYIKFRQCLAVVTEWKEIFCQFVCHKVSHCLASLMVPSSIENNIVEKFKFISTSES